MELWHWAQHEDELRADRFLVRSSGCDLQRQTRPEDGRPCPWRRSGATWSRFAIVPGAIEGEELKIVEKTGGKTQVQASESHDWSGNAQLWWIDGKPGDRLVLEVPVQEAGRYQVTADLTKAVDYGDRPHDAGRSGGQGIRPLQRRRGERRPGPRHVRSEDVVPTGSRSRSSAPTRRRRRGTCSGSTT